MQWMGVVSLPRGARGSPLFYQLHKTAPLLTITLCHYEANSQLETHTQHHVHEPSAYWNLHFNPTGHQMTVHVPISSSVFLCSDYFRKSECKTKYYVFITRGVATVYIPPNQSTCFMWLFCLLDPFIPTQIKLLFSASISFDSAASLWKKATEKHN